jgi:hypothetical protein
MPQITTTNRQAMLNLIQQAEETGEILILQEKTQNITGAVDRTTISINETDGQTFDITNTFDITTSVNINSSDSITALSADINVSSEGQIGLSAANDDTGESAGITIDYGGGISFNSSNVGNSNRIQMNATSISISGVIDDSPLTIINISWLPTSASGLDAGTIYKDGSGFLKIA